MSNFKIGDKVKCVRADFGQYINEGEIYTVKEVRRGCFGGTYVVLEEIDLEHSYELERFELVVDTPQPKFKAGDKVKTPYGEFEVLWVGNLFYSGKQGYVCYKEGFSGHSAKETVGPNVFDNTKHKGQCWNFMEDELELVVENNCKQTPKNYRELTPDTLIDISIDGNEFKVTLGDLIHTEHLLGISTGKYGYNIWKVFNEVLDKEKTLLNNQVYSRNETFEQQRELIKIYFIDKEKEAKKQALKEVIEKQSEEIFKLEQVLSELEQKFATLDES